MTKIESSEPIYRWRRVSIEYINVYILWNAPVEAQGQTFSFGQLESGVEAIAPDIEGKMAEGAGDSSGNQNGNDGNDGGDGNEGSTMSSGGIDSI